MKIKSLVLVASLFLSGAVFAQKGELNKGKTSYSKFNEVKQIGNAQLGVKDLAAAKESLEKASTHDKTKDLSETWTYLALVYTDYALLDSTQTSEEYKTKAVAAIEKAKAGEGSEEQAQNIDVANRTLAQVELTKGVKAFEKQDYAGAYQAFNNGLVYLPGDTLFNYYGGLAAINAKDYPNAIKKYESLLAHPEFSTLSQVYLDLSRLTMMENDTTAALKYAKEGAAKFPQNADLVTQNIELNLQMGNEAEVIADIAAQIEKNPDDARLHYYHGIALSANDGNLEAAEAAYKKAIEKDPEFATAYVNLGGLILNKGINVFKEASKLPANKQKEYNEQAKIGNAYIDEALPYLQKATEVAPELSVAWQNLKTYYQVKENAEKVAEIDEKMKNL